VLVHFDGQAGTVDITVGGKTFAMPEPDKRSADPC
jgi:hypothetical protein